MRTDSAERIRGAIRAVAVAQRLVADDVARSERHRLETTHWAGDSAASLSSTDAADRAVHESTLNEARAALKTAVDSYVVTCRTAGDAPERAVVCLKIALADAPTDGLDVSERRHLLKEAVYWGIDAYYQVG
jgi:hypothetical protein